MRRIVGLGVVMAGLALVMVAAACAGSAAQQTAPTPAAASAGSGVAPAGGASGSSSTGATSDTGGTGPSTQTPPSGFAIAMGAVSGVTGDCPALALVIDGKKVSVDAKTVFEGGTCATLKAAAKAAAGGPLQTDGSILAQRVKLGDAMPQNPQTPQPGDQAKVQGVAANVTGTCPTVALAIDGKKVSMTAATKFEKGACADLKNGAMAGAIGKLVDGVIVAERAIVAQAGTGPQSPQSPTGQVTVQGIASKVDASKCPIASLTIDGKAVSITAATKWERGTCADLKDGVRAGAIGKLVNGVIVAERAITAPK